MDWDALGAIGELVGAGGVIATLAYLSIQIRNSTNVDRAHIRANLTGASHELIRLGVENAEILVKASDGSSLDAEERFKLLQINRFAFRSYENYAYQRTLGLFEESEWRGIVKTIETVMSSPYAQEDWRAIRTQFSQATRNILDPHIPDTADSAKAPGPGYGIPNE